MLEFARTHGTRRLLFTSSGAMYGKQPPDLTHIPEDYAGAPSTMDLLSPYGQAKRTSEWMCAMYAAQYGFAALIARLFAFVGPHLPLDANFAVGNFIRDAMRGGPIRIAGDGTPYRSYLYAADLAIWLWTILLKGESCRPYNVGSAEEITIADLARTVAENVRPGIGIEIAAAAGPGSAGGTVCAERGEGGAGIGAASADWAGRGCSANGGVGRDRFRCFSGFWLGWWGREVVVEVGVAGNGIDIVVFQDFSWDGGVDDGG